MSNKEVTILKEYLENAYRTEMEIAKDFKHKRKHREASLAITAAETYREIWNKIDKITKEP